MSITVYVPGDAAALSVGAEAWPRLSRAKRLRAARTFHVVRNGSRGMFWLEPLVEVETPQGRIAYGPVTRRFSAGLLRCGIS